MICEWIQGCSIFKPLEVWSDPACCFCDGMIMNDPFNAHVAEQRSKYIAKKR